MEIQYDRRALIEAALFLEKNNKLCVKSFDEWKEQIYADIKRYGEKGFDGRTGTGGYTLNFGMEDENIIGVDITVDPSVGMQHDYMFVGE